MKVTFQYKRDLNSVIKTGGWCLLVLLLLSTVNVFSQPTPPRIRCISVESNGNVTLMWQAPVDTGTLFGGYHIYSATSLSGPYSLADSLFNYNTFSTTLTGVNANNTTLYFYIRSRQGCCNTYSSSSDTLRSMRMIVTSLSNETVRLNWNRIHTPPLPSTLSSFVVSKELTAGVYTNFRTLPDTTTVDTNIFCNKFINYKVTQGDVSGCLSVSSVDGEVFRDTKGPSQPLIDTVSINLITGNVNITWFPDSSADTQGYVIYQFNGVAYDSIGTVNGINTLSFTNTVTNSASQIETYSVAAFDSCKNLGSLAVNHNTMLLTKSFVKCTATLSLQWNAYMNMQGGLQRYEIWYRENTGAWTLDGFVPGTTLLYEKVLTVQGASYDFVIRAIGGDNQTASSNSISQVADIFNQPLFLYIRSLDVTGSAVTVKCLVDAASAVISYRLYRGNSTAGPFTFVSEIPFPATASVILSDPGAGADKQKVYYKLTATDSCGLEQVTSNIAGTVFLVAEGGNDLTSNLNWIDYTGWEGVTGHFNIFRADNSGIATTPFATVSGDTLFLIDDVSDFPVQDGNICYAVQAVEAAVNTFGFIDSSFSNVACAPQTAAAYIPNAFTPEGKNPIFKPLLVFGDPATYSFQVFNRWGQLVFASSVPEVGWNGTYQDSGAPAGIYAYQMVFKGFNKKEIRRTGTVLLLR